MRPALFILSLSLAPLPGLSWNTSQLYTTGILSITGTLVPEPTSLTLLALGVTTLLHRRRRTA